VKQWTLLATVSSNNSGLTASVPAQGAGSTFTWTIAGGTITGGQGRATLTFTSGGVGALYLTCQAANAAARFLLGVVGRVCSRPRLGGLKKKRAAARCTRPPPHCCAPRAATA